MVSHKRFDKKTVPTLLKFYSWSWDSKYIDFCLNSSKTHHRSVRFVLRPTSTSIGILDASAGSTFASSATSTAENPKLWSYWYRNCSESHESCHKQIHSLAPFTPDRLIEIFTDDDGNYFSWRLVSRSDIGNVPYLTLSHCWGSSKHLCLTKKTRDDSAFARFITYSCLPLSFQHAFIIMFSLGLRFIWIDSLCIIQDDPEDWKAQASMMGLVYKNACCNIAATWAADSNAGYFTKRASTIITLKFGVELEPPTTECQVSLASLYYYGIREAPLNQRGWVMQERFLARRQLSFTQS